MILTFLLPLLQPRKQISVNLNDVLQKQYSLSAENPIIVKFPQGNNAIRLKSKKFFWTSSFISIHIYFHPYHNHISGFLGNILKPMTSEHCMESFGPLFFARQSSLKITMLRKIIALEMRKIKNKNKKAYLQYCLEGIVSEKYGRKTMHFKNGFIYAKNTNHYLRNTTT